MVSQYGYEQLLNAMFALAEEGSKKERLINAMDVGLNNITPDRDLPREMHGDFNKFMSEIKYKGSVPATVSLRRPRSQVESTSLQSFRRAP